MPKGRRVVVARIVVRGAVARPSCGLLRPLAFSMPPTLLLNSSRSPADLTLRSFLGRGCSRPVAVAPARGRSEGSAAIIG
ncbi:uncharacterized protein F5Z01DRAFT_658950 [Emericellopsis atlantica]|uniref:Uncharacterized protein n=1 Tax=Emericellopsis atlantica TaxID=2614577 RepID=A0A9P7ZJQ3_9HYPO|nr:uncharacterized protein F5Z01DRAFT_658950 [Emericellopsis atlantica]KAG9252997.1 hypothetical protein F5Z01DRAFT_658950 [Emericellopsis atlantica]